LGGLFTITWSIVDLVNRVTLVGLLIRFLQPCEFKIARSFFPMGLEQAVELAIDTSVLAPTMFSPCYERIGSCF